MVGLREKGQLKISFGFSAIYGLRLNLKWKRKPLRNDVPRRVFVFFAHTAFIKTSPFMSHRQNICYINLFYINTIWQEYSWLVVLIVPSLRCLGQLLFSSYHMFFSNFLCEYLFTWFELFSLFTSYKLLFVTSVWHIKKTKETCRRGYTAMQMSAASLDSI